MSKFSMEDLIPIVAELSYKYTSGESTSVTYDVAKQLMGAVLYCIQEYEVSGDKGKYNVSTDENKDLAKTVYQSGYNLVVGKVKKAIDLYDEVISDIRTYRNLNYYDTIVKGIPAFFLYYDAKFNPQNHILTLDYATINQLGDLCGIDAIYEYLTNIRLEQQFLSKFSEEYVIDILAGFHSDYEELFVNICSIVLRNVIGHMIVGKKVMHKGFTESDFKILNDFVSEIKRDEVERKLLTLLNELIIRGYNNDNQLFEYLKEDIADFSVEFINAAQNSCLQRLFI